MTPKEAIAFVESHGVVLESARGPVPSLAATVAGEEPRGSWWGHPKGHEIFPLTRAVRASTEVLVCRLVNGKVTYVHRRLWPALARLTEEIEPHRIAAIREVHTEKGRHQVRETMFREWVPKEVVEAGRALSREAARDQLGDGFPEKR